MLASAHLRRAGHVLSDHVAFKVDAVARAPHVQVRVLPRKRDDHHVEFGVPQRGDRQTDAVDGNRSLGNQ